MRTHESNLPVCVAAELPLFVDSEGKELGKVNVLEVSWRPNEIKQKAELIVCLDVSAAMHGEPLNRAKEVIMGFRNDLMRDGRLSIAQIVTFAEGIKYHDMFRDDFEEGLKKVEADGKLNYLTLFRCLKDYIRTAEQTNICVIVLSCGPNTYGTMRDMELALNGLYEACSDKLVEFHTVGFGPENDVNLLRILSRIGSCGSYQYAADERDLGRIFMGLENSVGESGYAAELVSAAGVVTKLVRCKGDYESCMVGNKIIKFRLYGADSSVLTGGEVGSPRGGSVSENAKCDIVFKTSRGKLSFPVNIAPRESSVACPNNTKFAACNLLLQRIELLYLQASSYAQQLSRKLPKGVVLEHTQQFSKFANTAKDIYAKITQADVFARRICMFSMIRLFDYLANYYNCLCKLSKSGEEELTFADLSILHSRGIDNESMSSVEKITIECEYRIALYCGALLPTTKNEVPSGEIKTNCLCFLGKNDTIMLDSEVFLDSALFAEDLTRHQDLFGLRGMSPVDRTKCTLVPLYVFEEHWVVARERRKMINVIMGVHSENSEFSLLSKLMHKMVEMFSNIEKMPDVKLSECEKHYKLLLETCAALLRENENEVKLLKEVFASYTNPGSEVRLPKYTPSNEVFLMKLFVAFYAKIIPIEKSEKFVEKLNLLCLFMFEEEMRRQLGNIPFVNGDYLWKILNIDPEIYAGQLEEIRKKKMVGKFASRFGVVKSSEIVPALKLFTLIVEEFLEEINSDDSELPEPKQELPFDSILSFNFANDLQKHIDRFDIPDQIRDLMSIQSPHYQFILDFMSMCTGSTISTENNFGICSLAILLQNILHLDTNARLRAILNSDFAAVKNPEDIGFGTPYMFKTASSFSAAGLGSEVLESISDDSRLPPTLSTYIDMVSIGCYDRAQLYIVFLMTQKCLEFLARGGAGSYNSESCEKGHVNKLVHVAKFANFATCTNLCEAVETLDGCKFGSDFSKYLDALLSSSNNSTNDSLVLDKLSLLVFGGFFKITAPNKLEFVQLIDDIPADRKVSIAEGQSSSLTVSAWKPNKQNIYKVWAKLGHLAPKSWWLQLFSHNKHAVECKYIEKLRNH